jgi:hypothetical protein
MDPLYLTVDLAREVLIAATALVVASPTSLLLVIRR